MAAMGLKAENQPGDRDRYRAIMIVEHVIDGMERDETWASLTDASGTAWHLLALLAADRRSAPTAGSRAPGCRTTCGTPRSGGQRPGTGQLAGFSSSHFSALFRAVTGFSSPNTSSASGWRGPANC